MEIKQLEAAIEKKAQERAEERAKAFITEINRAWMKFFGHDFRTHNSQEIGEEEAKHLKKVFTAIARTEGSRYFRTGYFLADFVLEFERDKLVNEILTATEAIKELAGIHGEGS